jgi:hypothetical protein
VNVYPDSETLIAVMYDIFTRVLREPELLKSVRDGKHLLRIRLSEPDAVLLLDGRNGPVRFSAVRSGGDDADVRMHIPAGVLHEVWMGHRRMRDAYMAGEMKLESNPLKALGLLNGVVDLFRFVESIYPGILREYDLLEPAGSGS